MKYAYENPKELIDKITSYIVSAKKNGMFAREGEIENESNVFLKLLLNDLVFNINPTALKNYKRFIKYYVKELDSSQSEKYKIKKQLKMILKAITLFAHEESIETIKFSINSYYNVPRKTNHLIQHSY
jgi:flagellar motor component MotA